MDITLYRFSKRSNSTKRPSGSGIGTFACDFIQPTSIHNPSIILYDADLTNILTANYAKFNNEYFYVSDIVVNTRDSVTLQLNKDVLASFKTEIGNTRANILFSTSDYDPMVADPRISAKSERIMRSSKLAHSAFGINSAKWFVLSLVGDNGKSLAYTTHLLLSSDQLQDFLVKTMQADVLKAVAEFFGGNSMESALVSCRYYPFDVSTFVTYGTGSGLYLGGTYLNLSSDVKFINARALPRTIDFVKRSFNFDLENWNRGDFRDFGAYRDITLNLPFCAPVNINASLLNGKRYIHIETYVDVINGVITHDIYSQNNATESWQLRKFMCSVSGQCAMNIPIGQSTVNKDNVISVVTGIASTAASFANGQALSGFTTAMTTLSSIGDLTQIGMIGSSNSLSGAEKDDCEYALYVNDIDLSISPADMADLYGRPLSQIRRIGDLSGYVQTENASISADAPEEEINAVNSALNGGIYYE